jgi:AGZA family xanthine/uracil permease-like MFS transporter
VKGAILISIVTMTVLAIIINSVADIKSWGLMTPKVPDKIVDTPDFGLIGHFSLFGAFGETSAITVVLLIFTLILSDFFDAMGTIVGISAEAGLLDEDGRCRTSAASCSSTARPPSPAARVRVLQHRVHRVGVRGR